MISERLKDVFGCRKERLYGKGKEERERETISCIAIRVEILRLLMMSCHSPLFIFPASL